MELESVLQDLKCIIMDECDKAENLIDSVDLGEPIVGEETRLALDSLDILQLSVAIHRKYGIRIERNPETRKVFLSIRALGQYIVENYKK